MKTNVISILFGISIVLFVNNSTAQQTVGNYSFTALSDTFVEIIGGTNVSVIQADDAYSNPLPIGFTFVYEGNTYDSVIASSNGWLSFNLGVATSALGNSLSNSTSNIRPLVAPLWDDLDGRAPSNASQASYQTSGTSPNRVFTMEWKNWEWTYNAGNKVISFQVKLYEGSNIIDFVYRQEAGFTSGPLGASIGLAGVLTGSGNFLSLSSSSSSPSASSTSETTNITTKPATGQVYRFTPPAPPPIDLATSSVLFTNAGCYDSTETIELVVKNFGTSNINFASTNATVGFSTTGAVISSASAVITSGTLNSLAQDTFQITTSYNAGVPGDHIFKAYVNITSDGNAGNDTLIDTVHVDTLRMAPQSMDFTGYNGSNLWSMTSAWFEGFSMNPIIYDDSDWRNKTGLGGASNTTAAVNLYSTGAAEWIFTPYTHLSGIPELSYDAAITDWISPGISDTMGSDDALYVFITNDCGHNWDLIDSVVRGDFLPASLTPKKVDLTNYSGDDIYIGFFATDGIINDVEDYDLHLDNIEIRQAEFQVVNPANNTNLTIEDSPAQTLEFSWNMLNVSATYKWRIFNSGAQVGEYDAVLDTSVAFTYHEIDSFLSTLPLAIGQSAQLEWTVYAFMGSSDSVEAINGPRTINFTRGVLTQEFDLLTPSNNADITVSGSQSQTIDFTWENNQYNGSGDVLYTFHLDEEGGDFATPLISKPSNGLGVDRLLEMDFDQLSILMSGLGLNIGDTLHAIWIVTADLSDTSTSVFSLDLVKGIMNGQTEIIAEKKVALYPSPSNGVVNLEFSDSGQQPMEIVVYNTFGQVVQRDIVIPESPSFIKRYNFSTLPKGTYEIAIIGDEIKKSLTFVLK